MTVVFYVSGHGFGHAARAIEVINALVDRRPDTRVVIRSSVAPWLIERTARPGVALEPLECDTGVVQIDSLNLDETETICRARAFMSTFPSRVEEEARWLIRAKAAVVVADLPPLGIAAGRAAGIRAIALGNFTWDWIYGAYAGGADLAESIGRIYTDTTVALRLPMWGGFATMRHVVDLPFVARRSSRAPVEVRSVLGLPQHQRIVLMSFGGYGLATVNVNALAHVHDYHVVVPGSIDAPAMYAAGFRYEDLIRAVDVVVTKPGYGIISECLANNTALLYTSRGHFAEYDVLVAAMPRFLRSRFIDQQDLFSGSWGPHLDALLAQPDPPEKPATNGAEIAAERILEIT